MCAIGAFAVVVAALGAPPGRASTAPSIGMSPVLQAGATDAVVTVDFASDTPGRWHLDWGTTAAYGSSTAASPFDAGFVSAHPTIGPGIQPGVVYHVRTVVEQSTGSGFSAPFYGPDTTFETTSASGGSSAQGLTFTVSGPAAVLGIPLPRFVLTVAVSNRRADGQPLTGLHLSDIYTGSEAIEVITGPVDCSSGCLQDLPLQDIAPGATAIFTMRFAPTEYGTDVHHFTLASNGPATTATADLPVRLGIPQTAADWRIVVSPPVGTGGLNARHQVTVSNLGPADGADVVVDESLAPGEQVLSITSTRGTCTPVARVYSILVVCQLGTVPANETVAITVDTKMPPDPASDGFHVANIRTATPGPDYTHMNGQAEAIFSGRFWLCRICIGSRYEFADHYLIGSGYTISSDDVVQLRDGSIIRRDGILARADGKLVLPDGSIVPDPNASPRPRTLPPLPSPPSGGGGGTPPEISVKLDIAPQPRAIGDQFTYVATLYNDSIQSSDTTVFTLQLPAGAQYLGAKVERGTGCTIAEQIVTCNLDFFPGKSTTRVLVDVKVTAGGDLTASTGLWSLPADSNPSNDTATSTVHVGPPAAPTAPPAGPATGNGASRPGSSSAAPPGPTARRSAGTAGGIAKLNYRSVSTQQILLTIRRGSHLIARVKTKTSVGWHFALWHVPAGLRGTLTLCASQALRTNCAPLIIGR